ncbi:hypothetical protein KUCAC02_028161 [Chaenocephalus aceratus]|uniref:Uncharacterized protein n=1 Tax=Chaenocephalus aceratus TaxID=36190 RepID=A0ACB9X2T7_CHAAC|nr:hypothetical protein KUCAC02_028161 [Chaenocephalus aceratus]
MCADVVTEKAIKITKDDPFFFERALKGRALLPPPPAEHEYDALKHNMDVDWASFQRKPLFYLSSVDSLVDVISYRNMAKREELLNVVDLLNKNMLLADK